jgi:hypothetical protein
MYENKYIVKAQQEVQKRIAGKTVDTAMNLRARFSFLD